MRKVSPSDLDPGPFGDGVDRRVLAGPLGATGVALNRYRIAPDEGLPAGLHAHRDQEEIFLVLEGTATFEVLARGEGDDRVGREVPVEAGEAIRFAPGEFQSGRNDGEDDLVVLAIGAPRNSEDVRLPFACADCGHDDLRLDAADGDVTFACPDCGSSRVPAPCPDCGSEDLGATLGDDDGVVVACGDCGAEFDDPPLASR